MSLLSKRSAALYVALLVSASFSVISVSGCASDSTSISVTKASQDHFTPESQTSGYTEKKETPVQAVVNMSGDLLWHDTVWLSAKKQGRKSGKDYDYGPMFEHIADIIGQADLSICQEEVPFAKASGPFSSYPMFNTPPQVVAHLAKIGFDVCSTASNHSVDAGFDGLKRTLDVLDENNIAHFGTARTKEESQ